MNIQLPFQHGDNLVELGGGDKPIRVDGLKFTNVDVRQVQGVDIVRNLEEDFSDIGKFDGLIAVYLAEHIGWRKVQGFFNSCYAILKDGKPAVFIIPDTEEQMRLALNKEFDLGTSEMIFGGQDYGDNAHKVAFSKSFVTKLLKEAGFSEVNITNHPDPQARDIIVVATKGLQRSNSRTVVDGKPVYEEAYFTTDAYTFGGYRDFPVHALTVQKILERKPKSVVELGGAMGFICKRLGEAGVPATCLDVSKYCYDHRATEDFVLMDLAKDKIPKMDKEYDLAFSIAFLEHIPEKDLDFVIRESMRVSKRGLHGITFTIEPSDIDETHRIGTIKPKAYWQDKFKSINPSYPVEIVDKEDLERPVFTGECREWVTGQVLISKSDLQRYLDGELTEGTQ